MPALDYDLFISSYNTSERVTQVFTSVSAPRKVWLIHGEYGFTPSDFPVGAQVFDGTPFTQEADFLNEFLDWITVLQPLPARICIDITGMMRPHLILLPLLLRDMGISRVDIIYTDPQGYTDGSATRFSLSEVTKVGQVAGYMGTHVNPGASDALIVGGGYDSNLVQRVAESKSSGKHYLMLGLPGLQAHMYQGSRERMDKARPWLRGFAESSFLYAPASDPFMTAQVLQDSLRSLRRRGGVSNVYLSPLGSKAQALGFALYFLMEEQGKSTSLIFPFVSQYSEKTSVGLSRVHIFELELEDIPRSQA